MLQRILHRLRFRQPRLEPVQQIATPSGFQWDKQVDLLVAGFGGAGAAAGIEAHDQGLDVLVIERLEGGGSTRISGGIYYAGGGTRIQQAAGVEDSADNMYHYLKQEVQDAVSDKTLRAFCDQSLDNFNWMEQNGVPFEASQCPFKTSYPPNHYYFYYSGNESFAPYTQHATPAARGHRGKQKGVSGKAIFDPLKQAAKQRGIALQTHTKLVSLLVNSTEDVIGAKCITVADSLVGKALLTLTNRLHILLRYMALYTPALFNLFAAITERIENRFGKSLYIQAKHGVVLATGGFYANQAMVQQHAPSFVGGSPLGTMTDDGTGIRLAEALGAQTALMDKVSAWRFINPPLAFVKGVLVGPSGERVCNEMLYGAQVGQQMMSNHDGKAWLVLDHATWKAAWRDLTLEKGLWFHIMLGWFYLVFDKKRANSIRGLALRLGIEPAALHKTVTDYNAIATSGQEDPMGKPAAFVTALENGPYHAVNVSYDYFYVPCPSLTLGGLRVDEASGLVLGKNNKVINGLYAAGRTAVGIPSKGYVSGLSIADCIFSGRRAARHAAAAEKSSPAPQARVETPA